MRNSIIRDIYSGKLLPFEKWMQQDSEMAHKTASVEKAERQLRGSLNAETIPLLNSFELTQSVLNSMSAESAYVEGFKGGALLMLEILNTTDAKNVDEG